MKPELLATDDVTDEMRGTISSGLRAFSRNAAGYTDRKPIAVIVRDPSSGATLGGAIGRSSFGMLSLDVFYLPPELRGAGLGTEILRAFEEEGRRHGCKAAVLHTISFEAPGFLRTKRLDAIRGDCLRSARHEPDLLLEAALSDTLRLVDFSNQLPLS